MATWLTHLEHDPRVYAHWLAELGAGLSLEAKVADLEAVIDASQLDQVDLLGLSGGGPVAIA